MPSKQLNMAQPFFSVIIPTYNRLSFLRTAVISVLAQSFDDFECVIVDDGSTDATRDLVKGFRDPRLTYLFFDHRGISFARNHGVRSSKGQFIAFLDSDDAFEKQKLEETHRFIQRYPQFKIFHTEELWYRNGDVLPQKNFHAKPDGQAFEKSLRLCCISISTASIKREVFDEVGLFDESLPACEDYDFWLRATSRYPVKRIDRILTVKAGGHLDQLSRKYPAMDRFRIYSIHKLLESGLLSEEQRRLAIGELRRKCTIYINGARKRNKISEVEYFQDLVDSYN